MVASSKFLTPVPVASGTENTEVSAAASLSQLPSGNITDFSVAAMDN